MALSGSLREFSLSEIIQLLSHQQKTGQLTLTRGDEQMTMHFSDGRIVGSRRPGLEANDPLRAFLRRVHWLSDEQMRGIETLHAESGRDLVDILINGRYVDMESLTIVYERMVIDLIFRLLTWDDGKYWFDTVTPPESHLPLSLSTEGILMEAVRRQDEWRRYRQELPEAHMVPGIKELPDPDASLGEEEKELFALVNGIRTLGEIIAEAPLCDFEAMEGLASLFENGWLEVTGSREVGAEPEAQKPVVASPSRRNELVLAGLLAVLVLGLTALTAPLRQPREPVQYAIADDAYQRSRWRDVEMALAAYQVERGRFPARLEELIESEWLTREQLRFPNYALVYRTTKDGAGYELEAVRAD